MDPADWYSLPPWSEARFDRALARATGAETFVCSAPLPRICRLRLIPKGFRSGNARFAKLLHVDPAGWRKLLVVTSEFHVPRTRIILDTVFGFESGKYQPAFASAENRGPMQAVRKSRRRDRRATPGPGSGYRAIIWSLTEARTASTQRAVA